MDTQTIPENDGPALAMSVLYEANDLLNALRTVSEESANRMGSTEWTLSSEVSLRLNRAIALLDHHVPTETAEGMADSLATDDYEDEEQPEPLELHVISDRLQDRIRWAHGVIDIMMSEPDSQIAQPIVDAASGAAHYLREALEVVRSLDRWRYEHHPLQPRDLSNPNQREDEKRDLVRRLLRLKHSDVMDVTMTHIMIAKLDDQAEGLRLLEKYPLSYVHKFLSVRKDESEGGSPTD